MSSDEGSFMGNIIKGATVATAGMMAFEAGLRWREKLHASRRYHFWRNYYSDDILKRVDQLMYPFTIRSAGETLHVDLFQQTKKKAPVVIFNHGAAGYGRLMLPLALNFYDKGYNVLMPDRLGQGLSSGTRGDYTIKESTTNIVDVARWAGVVFDGPLYMAGGSLGGALSYYAAGEIPDIKAVACLNLFDFSFNGDGIQFTGLDEFVDPYKLSIALEVKDKLSQPWQWVRVPFNLILPFEKMMEDEDRYFLDYWFQDPYPNRWVSLRCLFSYLNSPPPIPLELNETPVLVLNQQYDRLVDPELTKNNYNRLAGPKSYDTIPFGHWASRQSFWDKISEKCIAWFNEHK